MNDSVRLGRIAGVRVGLNWTLLAMVALVAGGLADNRFAFEAPGYSTAAYAAAGAITALVLLFGVLLHELGHAVIARRVGLQVDGITLSWMGGVTRIEGDAHSPAAEFAIAGVGPMVSAAFGGLLWAARVLVEGAGGGRLAVSALAWLAAINLVLAVFNLLPASPLDGGRVLHSVVWGITRDRWRATRVAASAGVALGSLMVGGRIPDPGPEQGRAQRLLRQLHRVVDPRFGPGGAAAGPGPTVAGRRADLRVHATGRRSTRLDHGSGFRRHLRQRPPRLGVAARALGRGLRRRPAGRRHRVCALPAVGPGPAPGCGHAHLGCHRRRAGRGRPGHHDPHRRQPGDPGRRRRADRGGGAARRSGGPGAVGPARSGTINWLDLDKTLTIHLPVDGSSWG